MKLLALAAALSLSTCGHPAYAHEQYKDWKQPNGASCCNNSDCEPTEARWNGTQWEAMFKGKWIKIPADRVMKFEAQDGNAHLCAIYGYGEPGQSEAEIIIYCFTSPAARG